MLTAPFSNKKDLRACLREPILAFLHTCLFKMGQVRARDPFCYFLVDIFFICIFLVWIKFF